MRRSAPPRRDATPGNDGSLLAEPDLDQTWDYSAERFGFDVVRAKIRATVRDPEITDKLMPDHFVMTKRPILENGYFEVYDRDNVTLVDPREDPIERFTETSVVTCSGEHPIDMLVLATGLDAMAARCCVSTP